MREVDAYLAALDEPKRTTLQTLRRTISGVVPGAEEVISYGMPGFRLNGNIVAGFAAFKDHLSYLPHSGSVLSELSAELKGYKQTPGSLHFAVDKPLPKTLVKKLIAGRLREIQEKNERPRRAR
jgi:uncharacterized protein YdhG (YjbR/CyaY superfamily)